MKNEKKERQTPLYNSRQAAEKRVDPARPDVVRKLGATMMDEIRRLLTIYNLLAEGHREDTLMARAVLNACLDLIAEKLKRRVLRIGGIADWIRSHPDDVIAETCSWLFQRIYQGRCVYLTQTYLDLRLGCFAKSAVKQEKTQRGDGTESFDTLVQQNDRRLAKTYHGEAATPTHESPARQDDDDPVLDYLDAAQRMLSDRTAEYFTTHPAQVFAAWCEWLRTAGTTQGFAPSHRRLFRSARQTRWSAGLKALLGEVYECLGRILPGVPKLEGKKKGVKVRNALSSIVRGADRDWLDSVTTRARRTGANTHLVDFDYAPLVRDVPQLMKIVRLYHLGKTQTAILHSAYGMPGDLDDRDEIAKYVERLHADLDAIVGRVKDKVRLKQQYVIGSVRVARFYGLSRSKSLTLRGSAR